MRTIEVSDETYDRIKDQLAEDKITEINGWDDLIGKCWFFRTVTYHHVGRVVKVVGNIIQLEKASWVADSGRFTQAIKEGKLNEVEPVGEILINRDTIVDFFPWNHPLPKGQK